MFHCVDCDYKDRIFHVKVVELDQNSWTYKAICPECASEKVNVLPGPHEEDIRIVDVSFLKGKYPLEAVCLPHPQGERGR